MKINVVGRTFTRPMSSSKGDYLFSPENIKKDMSIIGGKAAGICYMPDDYLSEGIQNEAKALARAARISESGHYSVYEHGSINFIIEADKMMAMILNSLGLYATSEKSARYTSVNPGTDIEKQKYEKWKEIFKELIEVYYKDIYNVTDIEKLSMENARYMVSVFTPTILEYTVPFNRAILTCEWLDVIADNIDRALELELRNIVANMEFYKRVANECREMADQLRQCIGITKDNTILEDHKKIGIELFYTLSSMYKLEGIYENDSIIAQISDNCSALKQPYYGDSYTSNYEASIAAFAQEQRHRTIHYSIELPLELDCYIPKIIRGSRYEVNWREDFSELARNNITPQCTLLNVCEQGRFEDFVLKCKERLCARAQLEIMEITREQVTRFASYKMNLNPVNVAILNDMYNVKAGGSPNNPKDILVKSRCMYSGYTCKEHCKLTNQLINYCRNI